MKNSFPQTGIEFRFLSVLQISFIMNSTSTMGMPLEMTVKRSVIVKWAKLAQDRGQWT
jgi:hypothetical protein